MNLHEQINRIQSMMGVNESHLTSLKRRLEQLDEDVESIIESYNSDMICSFENSKIFLEDITETAIESMYYIYFSDIDDESDEWELYYGMIDYISKKYGERIDKIYQTNCGG